MGNVAEHRIHMLATPAGKAAAPEKRLNLFVHLVALIERFGNALGTLAFTWATVVLLGGYPTELRPRDDFSFATIIVFLEALRMFGRNNNRLDYQLFFRTRGAFRYLGWNGLILTVCFLDLLLYITIWSDQWVEAALISYLSILAIGRFLSLVAARLLICNLLCRAISLWSPMVAILLLGPSVPFSNDRDDDSYHILRFTSRNSIARWTVYLVLFVVVLLLTISRLRFPSIIKLVDCSRLVRKVVFWRQVIINLCLFAVLVMLMFAVNGSYTIAIIIYPLLILSLGNLQIPAAVLRIVLTLIRLIPQNYYNDDKTNLLEKSNLVPSLNIFYGMVLGQGILYILACILEVFSFFLRRSLIRHAGFSGQLGVEYVDLYYTYAFDKCMGGAVLAPKKISLITFAMDSIKSDTPKMQLYGLQMLHSFVQKEPFKSKAISKLTTSTKTVTLLFNMFGWTGEGDNDIRSFAVKVTNELADSLLVAPIPGAMQLIATLLDTVHQPEIKNPLLDIGSPEAKQDATIQQFSRDRQSSPMLKWWKQMVIYCLIPVEEPSNMDEQNTFIRRCWKQITKCWSVPEEEASMDQDLLPVLGMSILDRLARFDLENCMEISKATGLISKIIEFTSGRTNMTDINEIHQLLLKRSSLKVLRTLAGTKGKFGVTLRQKISEHPFILSNLAEILDDSGSSKELRELTAEILRNLAVDGNTGQEIRHIRVIISRLMHAFLSRGAPSSTDSDQLLRMIAGQALAVLAMESANNCLAMLAEPGYAFIKELTIMIHGDRYMYVASSLLRNMCAHARPGLGNSDLMEVSYILREVLEGIMDAEGAELEILVGLSSQICNVIPEDFARELEHGQIKERFIKRLVNALNSNRIPTAHCPGIRRATVEHVIYMMECNPSYANCFNKCWMMEALLMVERTPSSAENYRFFLGDAGLMEHSIPLSALVARAKELMGREWQRGISSVT